MKNQRRISSLIRRAVALKTQGVAKFAKRNELIRRAIAAGLEPGQIIEVEIADKNTGIVSLEHWVLVDNFKGEKTGGWATVNRFDLKEATAKEVKASATSSFILHPSSLQTPDPTEGSAE